MATYGGLAEPDFEEDALWRGQPLAVLGPDAHGFSRGLRAAVTSVDGPLPASQWMGRLGRAPGVRRDARDWYGIMDWLADLGDARVAPAALLERIDAREFTLEAGWSFEREDRLVLAMPRNPGAAGSFTSVHEPGIRNPLVHIVFGNLAGSEGPFLDVLEIQSDWHQEGAQSGWAADPEAYRASRKAEKETAEQENRDAVARVLTDPDLFAILVPGTAAQDGAENRHSPHAVWQTLRRISDGEDPMPDVSGLPQASRARLETALATFRRRTALYQSWRRDSPVPDAPFRHDWPRLALAAALACAAHAEHPDGTPVFAGIRICDGDTAAGHSRADEPVQWASWSQDPSTGIVRIRVITADENGNGAERPPIEATLDDLADCPFMPAIAEEIRGRILGGETAGELDSEWIDANFGEQWDPILWVNRPLRGFYDRHLPRELREVARSLGADADARCAILTAEARAALRATMPCPPFPGSEPTPSPHHGRM